VDTTTFVFGLQPPSQASTRRFKNVSLLWKIAGAVALSLVICLAVMGLSFRGIIVEVEGRMVADGLSMAQQRCDVEVSVLKDMLDDRLRDVASGVTAIGLAVDAYPRGDVASQAFHGMLEQRLAAVADRLSFFCVLDRDRRIVSSYLVDRTAGSLCIKRHQPGDRAVLPAWDAFEVVDRVGATARCALLEHPMLAPLGVANQASVLIRTDRADDVRHEVRGLALVGLHACTVGDRRLVAFGGRLLNNDTDVLGRSGRSTGAHTNALMVTIGPVCVSTTARSSAGRLLVGEQVPLPSSRSGTGADTVWRGTTPLDGRLWVTTWMPIVSSSASPIGHLGAVADVEACVAPRRAAAKHTREVANRHVGVAVVLAVSLALVVGGLVARQVMWPLACLTRATEQVADGNLAVDVTLDGDDELGLLASGFRNMVRNLRALTRRIEDATVSIAEAVELLRHNLGSQAATSAQQSVAINETTATLEELAASSRQIADSALAVVKVAAKTLQSAKRGVDSSQQTIGQMDRIRQSNADDLRSIGDLSARVMRIDEIMTLINTIADQTKLIAFNAAIEAAAAGTAGRRFSIVSEEIRRLAENVQDRATEIRRAIADVQRAADDLVTSRRDGSSVVEEGAEMTGQTSADLQDIHDDSQSVLQESKQISLSTQQQRSATEQTLAAVREISQGVNELATGARRTEDVVERLSVLATDLRNSVERFRLADDTATPEVQS